MAAVIEPIESGAPDVSTAVALGSLGLAPTESWDGFTALPPRVLTGIVALSSLISGIVWLVTLRAR